MKRWIALVLAASMLAASLCACGKDKDKDKDGPASSLSSTVSQVASSLPTSTPAAVQSAKAAKISADGGLNIRAEASTDAEILGVADDGSLLPLLLETPTDGWYQVEYEGKTGYISAEFATAQDVTLAEYNRLRTGGTSSAESSASSSAPSGTESDTEGETSSAATSSTASRDEDSE